MDSERTYLDRISTLSFGDEHWTEERIAEVRDFLGPWNHNIRLPYGVYTAYCEDYYPEHQAIMSVVDHEVDGVFAGKRVLDIGCLEGYFSTECALQGAEVLGIDGRLFNVKKCEFVKSVLGVDNVSYGVDDALRVTRERYGSFDVVLALGLLYHLDDPHTFLSNIAELCDGFAVIDTLIALEDDAQCGDGWPDVSELRHFELGGARYEGRLYREYESGAGEVERELSTTASIANDLSIWLTEDGLTSLLRDVGFARVTKVEFPRSEDLWWTQAPRDRVLFVAAKGRSFSSRVFGDA